MQIIIGIIVVAILISLAVYLAPVFIFLLFLWLVWKTYEALYYKGKKFLSIKSRIQSYISDCNELNQHIESLKRGNIVTNRLDTGRSSYQNESRWNVRRNELSRQEYAPNIYNCSLAVCDGARRDPFKYVCKYFNISAEESDLEKFEKMLNDFEAAEDGKVSLQKEKEKILESVQNDIPAMIRKFGKEKLEKNLGFEPVDLGTAHFPCYTFKYVSPGGNKSTRYDVVMDIDNLNKFVEYLSAKIKFRKSVAGQRSLMTSKLREKIKQRDGYACKKCGASIAREPNLLLEIDHVIPLARGGMTTESNLQTLCWRCNRSKGARM